MWLALKDHQRSQEQNGHAHLVLLLLRSICCLGANGAFALRHHRHGVQIIRHGNDGQQNKGQNQRADVTQVRGSMFLKSALPLPAQAQRKSGKDGCADQQPNEIEEQFHASILYEAS